MLDDLIETATTYVERLVTGHVQLRTATYDVPVLGWWGAELFLPRHPLQSVTTVKYLDTGGTQQTLSSSIYTVQTAWKTPGSVRRAAYQVWPALRSDQKYPVTIRFVCGYSDGNCPREFKMAIRLLVNQWYCDRCPVGDVTSETANSVRALLDSYGNAYRGNS